MKEKSNHNHQPPSISPDTIDEYEVVNTHYTDRSMEHPVRIDSPSFLNIIRAMYQRTKSLKRQAKERPKRLQRLGEKGFPREFLNLYSDTGLSQLNRIYGGEGKVAGASAKRIEYPR